MFSPQDKTGENTQKDFCMSLGLNVFIIKLRFCNVQLKKCEEEGGKKERPTIIMFNVLLTENAKKKKKPL